MPQIKQRGPLLVDPNYLTIFSSHNIIVCCLFLSIYIHLYIFSIFNLTHRHQQHNIYTHIYISLIPNPISSSISLEKNMDQNPSSSSSRADRKTIEKNRRNEMKALYSRLNSLLPHQSQRPRVLATLIIQFLQYIYIYINYFFTKLKYISYCFMIFVCLLII